MGYRNTDLTEAYIADGSIWLSQMTNGKGVFGDNTAKVLKWIAYMKKLQEPEKSSMHSVTYKINTKGKQL